MEAEALKKLYSEAMFSALAALWDQTAMGRRLDMLVEKHWHDKRATSRNPLVRAGEKYFSQNDEDGITLEILRRIGRDAGAFAELGVGNGLENNTLILLMSGWRGVWIGGEELGFNLPKDSAKLRFYKEWITAESCLNHLADGLRGLGATGLDYLSIDLDGNDLYVAQKILSSGLRPAVVVLEYNSKFPPPIRWSIAYDPNHQWRNDDYHGASLQACIDALAAVEYRLVACNITGSNAFFVRREFDAAFHDIPEDPAKLFVPADYNWFIRRGHLPSPRTIERFL